MKILRGDEVDALAPWWFPEWSEAVAIEAATAIGIGLPREVPRRTTAEVLNGSTSVAAAVSVPDEWRGLLRRLGRHKANWRRDHLRFADLVRRDLQSPPKRRVDRDAFLDAYARETAAKSLIAHGYVKIPEQASELIDRLDLSACPSLLARVLLLLKLFSNPDTKPQPGDAVDMLTVPVAISHASLAVIDRTFRGRVGQIRHRLPHCATVLGEQEAIEQLEQNPISRLSRM